MDTRELENLLLQDYKTRRLFGGVYPCDKLPRRRSKHERIFIANTDRHTEPGTHWVAFYFDNAGRCTYFDSYGLPPFNKYLLKFAKDQSLRWHYSEKKLQDVGSSVCGHYCVFFAHQMARGQSLFRFQQIFGADSRINDCVAIEFIKRQYNMKNSRRTFNHKHSQSCKKKKIT